MKKFLLLAVMLLGMGGIISVKAEVKTNWDPSNAYGTTWTSATNTLSWNKDWANVLYTGFAPKTNGNTIEVDLSKYDKIHYNITSLSGTASDDDGAYIDLKIGSTDNDTQFIRLREGAHDIVFADYEDLIDFSKILEVTVSATYEDGAGDEAAGSAVITEFYLYTNKWEIQQQKQTVQTYALGTTLSLDDIVTNNSLVAMVSGGDILYGKANDGSQWGSNQILAKPFDDAMALVKDDDNTSFQFRIIKATDADLTYPDGITTLYRIKAFKADGTNPFTGPGWNGGNSFFLQEIDWTYNVADGTSTADASFFAITPITDKTNTYKISAYKKDGTVRWKEVIYDKPEWTFNKVTESTTQEDVDVWVEVLAEDTEDPGVAEVPDGWKSVIANGTLDGDDVTNFWTKERNIPGDPETFVPAEAAEISNVGRKGGNGIEVICYNNYSDSWDKQFAITSSVPLPNGAKMHIEFDYRADEAATVSSQVHQETVGNWISNNGCGTISFGVNWKHFKTEFYIQDDNVQSIVFNLNEDVKQNTFYFDNIVLWMEKEKTTITMGEAGSRTYCFEKDLDFSGVEGLTAYVATAFDADNATVTMTKVDAAPANTGLYLVGEAGEYTVYEADEAEEIETNMLVGINTDGDDYVEPLANGYYNLVLATTDTGRGFHPLSEAGNMGNNKAYLQIPSDDFARLVSAGAPVRIIFTDEATAITKVATKAANKSAWYTLTGVKLNSKPTAKGLYIHEGKTFMVK